MKKKPEKRRSVTKKTRPKKAPKQPDSAQCDDEFIRLFDLHEKMYDTEEHDEPTIEDPSRLGELEKYNELLQFELKYSTVDVGVIAYGHNAKTLRPRLFEYTSRDCVPIDGNIPRVCPRAKPKNPAECLPQIATVYRNLKLVENGQTILWVGRECQLEEKCWYQEGCDCFHSQQQSGSQRLNSTSESIEFFGAVMLDDNGMKIARIARDGSKTVNVRMREIAAIDHRFYAMKSPQWAEVLHVTSAAVRATDFWKIERDKFIGPD